MNVTSSNLVVIGAGGHAKVVIEAVRAAGGEVVGLIDPHPPAARVLGVPVLGGDEVLQGLQAQGISSLVIALGNNVLRERMGRLVQLQGFSLPVVVHPSALVSPSARLGAGVVVMVRAVIGTDCQIGDLAIVNTGAMIDHDNCLGDAAHVAPGCALAGNVGVGARSLLGVGCAVRPGIRIGADAVIGAGSAVVSDVPDGARVAGVPARLLPAPGHRLVCAPG